MPEAVIVSTARTPIGRAFKGSLIEMRPDDLAAIAVEAALAKVPNLEPSTVEQNGIAAARGSRPASDWTSACAYESIIGLCDA